jgi:uncharacterized protein DUF1840
MLVTFQTKAHANITMFGDVAVALLKLAGMSGTVPTAILARDVPKVLSTLESGLRKALPESADGVGGGARNASNDDPDATPVVPLGHRALPLIELLRAANRQGTDVMISATR